MIGSDRIQPATTAGRATGRCHDGCVEEIFADQRTRKGEGAGHGQNDETQERAEDKGDAEHRLEWGIDDWEIRIGLGFAGGIDDFFVLDRPMTAEEVTAVHAAAAPMGEVLAL